LIAQAKGGFALRWVRLGDHETVVVGVGGDAKEVHDASLDLDRGRWP
jgi:hypothetical protein